jgi:gamma-glutamyltranspeptidase/glutathione hydrolase/leukotriene-C4 hydrolase
VNANKLMFLNRSSDNGGLSTTIPGEIFGFYEAYKIGGRLTWKSLFAPSIKMCREGFSISSILAEAIRFEEKNIRNNPELSKIFINSSTNRILKQNDIIKLTNLATTLEIISEQNISAFYNGSLTKIMVDEINENGNKKSIFLN